MGAGVTDARLLTEALRDPATTGALDAERWTSLIAMARAEQLIGTLAHRLHGLALPERVASILDAAKEAAEQNRRIALWEAECARRALAGVDLPIILLKGTAYLAAGLKAGVGRAVGDLDILSPRSSLAQVEAALLAAGWAWLKPDPYDDAYYREWMHELPPLIHRSRDRMIDVHHTILPLTARITPDAAAMIADRVYLDNSLAVLSPNDMICHAAAHLFADGDLAGGLRNLWDVHCLIEEFGVDGLADRAQRHGLTAEVTRAARLANDLYDTPTPDSWQARGAADGLFRRRLLARDGWGRERRPVTRLGFYVRSHWLRMPPRMLAQHLWAKWRRS